MIGWWSSRADTSRPGGVAPDTDDGGGAGVLAAAQTAATIPGETIVIAVLGMLGVAATAFGPALLERAKRRNEPPVTPTPAPAPTPPSRGAHAAPESPGFDAFDMLEGSLQDLRQQRDVANSRADRLENEIRELRRDLTAQITELSRQLREAELHLVRSEASRRGWGP